MWSKLRETVAGLAEQAGFDVPGLDSATAALTEVTGSATDALSGVVDEVAASDVVASAADATGAVAPDEILAGAGDATAGAAETVTGVVDAASATAADRLGKVGLTP